MQRLLPSRLLLVPLVASSLAACKGDADRPAPQASTPEAPSAAEAVEPSVEKTPAQAKTTASPSGDSSSTHQVTIENRCDQQIWLAEFGSPSVVPPNWALAPLCSSDGDCASGQSCASGSCTCASDADCTFDAPPGTTTATCDTGSGQCARSTQLLMPAGWSGRLWPRTGCSGSDTALVCATGQCGPATGGNIDCSIQGATADLATLFEATMAGANGNDNFDISLVSGYNVPISVTLTPPPDKGWQANTSYEAGAQIVQAVGDDVFGFTNSGPGGTSGATAPSFPSTWFGTVTDGSGITWTNTGPTCQPSGCTSDLLSTCPSALQVDSDSALVACNAPANTCAATSSSCNADLDFYQCQNNDGTKDLFGNVLTLQSPNASSFVCFSADDCPAGTTCLLDPDLVSGLTLPKGAGVCSPVAQNGGCTPADDGQPCPTTPAFPFVEYQCQTLTQGNVPVCLPPTTTGVGDLWWNANNWTATSTACSADSDCTSSQKCLGAEVKGGLPACTSGDTGCTCYDSQACSSARGTNDGCAQPNSCLNEHGVPDGKPDGGANVDCSKQTCYCAPQGIYSGACGPTNPSWNSAALAVGTKDEGWPAIFKEACPVAYAYQFDDPSSNWSCPNTDTLVGYSITLCGEMSS